MKASKIKGAIADFHHSQILGNKKQWSGALVVLYRLGQSINFQQNRKKTHAFLNKILILKLYKDLEIQSKENYFFKNGPQHSSVHLKKCSGLTDRHLNANVFRPSLPQCVCLSRKWMNHYTVSSSDTGALISLVINKKNQMILRWKNLTQKKGTKKST